MEKKITYIETHSGSLQTSLSLASDLSEATSTVDALSGGIWAATCITVLPALLEEYADESALKGAVEGLLRSSITAALPNGLPDEGIDRKTGRTVKLSKKDGSFKWSVWENTSRHFSYLSDIYKIYKSGLVETLVNKDNAVAARCDILKLCKGTEAPLQSIIRTCKSLQGFLDKMTEKADVLKAQEQVSALVVNNLAPVDEAKELVKKLNGILAACSKREKTKVLAEMEVLAAHFE